MTLGALSYVLEDDQIVYISSNSNIYSENWKFTNKEIYDLTYLSSKFKNLKVVKVYVDDMKNIYIKVTRSQDWLNMLFRFLLYPNK